MKIAMIGSGAAGSVFAGYLRRGGADITLVDPYKEHMDKIAKDGLTFVIYPDQEYQVTGYKTAYDAENIGKMDIVIFMTKATQLESAITRLKVKDLLADPNGLQMVIQVVSECCAVATAKGCPMDPKTFMMGVKQSGGSGIVDYYPSMAQDMLMFKRQTEIMTLNGAIAEYGKQLGIPTPACDFITKQVLCMQANYDKQYEG